jgi:hypothetical protein
MAIWNELSEQEGQHVIINMSIEVEPTLFLEAWLKFINQPKKHLPYLAQALARSMPYHQDYPIRRDIQLRHTHYTKLWLEFLQAEWSQDSRQVDFVFYSEKARQYFLNLDKGLSNFEGSYKTRSKVGDNILFGGIIGSTPLIQPLKDFFNAIQEIADPEKVFSDSPKNFFLQSSKGMEDAWRQAFLVKVLGAYLVQLFSPPLTKETISTGQVIITYQNKLGEKRSRILQRMTSQELKPN